MTKYLAGNYEESHRDRTNSLAAAHDDSFSRPITSASARICAIKKALAPSRCGVRSIGRDQHRG